MTADIRTPDYDAFAAALRAVDARDDVLVTIWQGIYQHPQIYTFVAESILSEWKVVLRVSAHDGVIVTSHPHRLLSQRDKRHRHDR